MSNNAPNRLSSGQQAALIALRTLIGWHFVYEGYYKLALPGWSSAGAPLGRWTSAIYLKAAPGPVARLFEHLVETGWANWVDNTVKIGLLVIGLSLILGIFTRTGCVIAILFLSLFYFTSMPLTGIQQPGSEGAYLLINKTLIEGAGVWVLLTFRTGEIAGLDLLLSGRKRNRQVQPAGAAAVASVANEASQDQAVFARTEN